jgi:hypothetical protein
MVLCSERKGRSTKALCKDYSDPKSHDHLSLEAVMVGTRLLQDYLGKTPDLL